MNKGSKVWATKACLLYQAPENPFKPKWLGVFWMRLWEIDALPVFAITGLGMGILYEYLEWRSNAADSILFISLLGTAGLVAITAERTWHSLRYVLYSFERLNDGSYRLEYGERGKDWVLTFHKEEATLTDRLTFLNTSRLRVYIRSLQIEVADAGRLRFYRCPALKDSALDHILKTWNEETESTIETSPKS